MGSSSGTIGAAMAVVNPVFALANAATIAKPAYSIYSGEKQKKEQKKAIREQQAAIEEEKEEALEKRKQMIDQQRMQMFGNGVKMRTGTKVHAKLGNDVLG